MDTIETQEDPSREAGSVYDGFISYSHDADDLLAPRLQAGLQRFAKPWWKRRALHIFRDESSLSASPHLWSSITSAIDQSDWLILLLSPEAAQSRWVNQEVEYWLEHNDADRVLPVVTDGEFRWANGDITPSTTAAPPALYGAFSGDPRWVDLRFAKTDEHLDLKNPRFSAAVADVASAIRGVPKDELESEEVRQHRRTLRTTWAAGAVVLLLAVLAGVAAVFALDQRSDAVAHAERADENAAEAQALAEAEAEAREDAEAATERETEARQEAERSALVASSNELSLRAEKEIPIDPERAMLLAIEAVGLARLAGEEPIEAARTLRTALASSRIVNRVETTDGSAFVSLTASGDLLVARYEDGATVWDTTSWEQVATFTEPDALAVAGAISPAGDRVAIAYEPLTENPISPVAIYDLGGGPAVSLDGDPPPFNDVEFASGGDIVIAKRFDAESESVGFGKWSATTGEYLGPLGDGLGPLDVDPLGERVATVPDDRFRIHDIASGAVLVDDGGGSGYVSVAFSPSGTRVAEVSQDLFSLRIRDAETGTVLLVEEVERITGVAWLDESRVAVGGELVRVVDAGSGAVLAELAGHEGGVWHLAAIPNTDHLTTQGSDGAVLVWDVTPAGLAELPSIDTGLPDLRFHWSGPAGSIVMRDGNNSLWVLEDGGSQPTLVMAGLVGFSTYSKGGSHNAFTRTDGTSGVVRVADGEVVYDAPEGLHALGVNDDASLVVLAEPWDAAIQWEQVPLVIDTATGETVGELTPPLDFNYTISPDSSLVSHVCCGAPNSSAYLLPGGEPTGNAGTFGSFFSPSGALLAYPLGDSGLMWLIDTARLKETKDLESASAAFIDAHDASIFGVFSPDESMMATSTFGEPIRVWNIAGVLDGVEPSLIAEIDAQPRIGPPSTSFSPDGKHILARSTDGVLLRFTLDTDELIAIAQSRLTRGLTPDECATFGIDPCPGS